MQLQPPSPVNSSSNASSLPSPDNIVNDAKLEDASTSRTQQRQLTNKDTSPLEILLSAVSNRWQEMRQFGTGSGPGGGGLGSAAALGSFADVRAGWQELMGELQKQQPQLVRLAAWLFSRSFTVFVLVLMLLLALSGLSRACPQPQPSWKSNVASSS
jgi:hypothetical protein